MSQIPPQQPYPPQNPQQPGYPPQPGYPQQPGYPPQPGGAYTQPPASNGWGITSLITGIVGFCVPVVGGILAVLFGLVGVARARKARAGMGLSIAGIILGLLSVGIWALFGSGIYALVMGTKINRDVAKQFITDLHSGNVSAAEAATDGSLPTSELQSVSDRLKAQGQLTDITTLSFNANASPGNKQVILAGAITFGSTQVPFQMTQVKSGDKWKVTQFVLDPNNATGVGRGSGKSGSATAPAGSGESSDEK